MLLNACCASQTYSDARMWSSLRIARSVCSLVFLFLSTRKILSSCSRLICLLDIPVILFIYFWTGWFGDVGSEQGRNVFASHTYIHIRGVWILELQSISSFVLSFSSGHAMLFYSPSSLKFCMCVSRRGTRVKAWV